MISISFPRILVSSTSMATLEPGSTLLYLTLMFMVKAGRWSCTAVGACSFVEPTHAEAKARAVHSIRG